MITNNELREAIKSAIESECNLAIVREYGELKYYYTIAQEDTIKLGGTDLIILIDCTNTDKIEDIIEYTKQDIYRLYDKRNANQSYLKSRLLSDILNSFEDVLEKYRREAELERESHKIKL